MIASIIIWFLGYYPRHDTHESVAEQQENSYIGQIGKAIEPVIKPLGFDWKLGIGLISGVGAKELVVSTLGVLYTNEGDVENVNLSDRIPITPLVALAYMLFVLIYFPVLPLSQQSSKNPAVEMGHIRSRIHHWIGLACCIYRIPNRKYYHLINLNLKLFVYQAWNYNKL